MDPDKTAPTIRGGAYLGRQPFGCRPRLLFFAHLPGLVFAAAAVVVTTAAPPDPNARPTTRPPPAIQQEAVATAADDEDAPPRLPILEPPPLDPQRPPPPQAPPASVTAAMTNWMLRPVGLGVFEIGRVRLDKSARTVSFPAVVNARQGPMEYLIVTPYGSTHESVLRTDAEPYHIHLSVLLLGAQGETHALENPPRATQVVDPWTQPIHGDPVRLEVTWEQDGTLHRCAAEDWVYNLESRAPMSHGSWTYNGSLVHRGLFRAQIDGTIASLIASPSALINNPRIGAQNDDIWTVNTNALPAMGTPVTVILCLQ
ncbi:MAG: hypothetical protein JNK85_18810 [Verrucomicrobiales bacterium]|nr:hypothetical protein [Verrucomicrobiales bacterium]